MKIESHRLTIVSLLVGLILGIFSVKFGDLYSSGGIYSYSLDRQSLFACLKSKQGGVLLIGDSHIDRGEWTELFNACGVYNRGINGDTVGDLLGRVELDPDFPPRCLIFMVGFNDLAKGLDPSFILSKYDLLLERVKKAIEVKAIFVNGVFPVQPSIYDGKVQPGKIKSFNQELQVLCQRHGVNYINASSYLVDEDGFLKSNLTSDGVHLNGAGYLIWAQKISEHLGRKGIQLER